MKVVALTLATLLAVALLPIDGSPLPGFAGLPDIPGMGQAFGAKIGNIIKGNTYDGLDRAMRKLSSSHRRSHSSSSDSDESDGSSSMMFGLSGSQFEELISMLQQSKQGGQQPAGQQQQPETGFGAMPVPFAAIDNSVD